MNKKGFAISVILYVIVFLIIAVFYIILGIVKSRYNVNNDLKNSIVSNLNGAEYIYSKLTNDNPVNILRINPNGGTININGQETSEVIEFIKYANSSINIPSATRVSDQDNAGVCTLSYNSSGGDSTPESRTYNLVTTTSYEFRNWESSEECGVLEDHLYTFPSGYGTICTLTAAWTIDTQLSSESVIVANGPSKSGFVFIGWKSSDDNQIYQGGDSLSLNTNTTLTAQWTDDVWAENLSYNDTYSIGCSNVQCALDQAKELLK